MSGADGQPLGATPVAILTALPEESRPLLRRLTRRRPASGAVCPVWEGELGGSPVLVAETGSGMEAAGVAAADVFARFRPARWIGAGFAGALSPDLAFASVVVAGELVDGAGRGVAVFDHDMARRALACDPEARAVRASGSARIVATRSEKARMLAAIGGALPVTVDTESAAWTAAAPGIPGLLVRVVSDSSDDEIPDFVASSARPGGGIDRTKVIRHALLRPASIGKLLALRRRARSCGERLADFLERFAARGF